jgi:hypothetical protein
MKRPQKQEDGMYHIGNQKFPMLIGSRQQVWHGTAYKTEGQLIKSELLFNKWGRIVSKKKHTTAKKEQRLKKHGFGATKGRFGYVRIGTKRTASTRRNNTSKKH